VPVKYRIPLDPVDVTLAAGHRLRVAIYSADPAVHEPLLVPAINSLYHDAEHPSRLRVTVR
jgi:predicted acyl esterase